MGPLNTKADWSEDLPVCLVVCTLLKEMIYMCCQIAPAVVETSKMARLCWPWGVSGISAASSANPAGRCWAENTSASKHKYPIFSIVTYLSVPQCKLRAFSFKKGLNCTNADSLHDYTDIYIYFNIRVWFVFFSGMAFLIVSGTTRFILGYNVKLVRSI